MMNDQEISSDKLSSKVNALLIIDIQEKIIRPIFNKDSIIKNIKKLVDAYQILEENIFISEQNPFKLGATIPELLPKKGFEVILISDSMGSRNRVDHEMALQRMTQSGAILTTTESIIFELCKTADRKEFKEIRNIIMS